MPKSLLYFVKYPEPGKVKTRLARTLGNEAAAEAYRLLAEHNYRIIRKLEGIETVVVFDPPEKESLIRSWLPADHYLAQCAGALGERLIHAFSRIFHNSGSAAAALGSDTLGLTPEITAEAFDKLKSFDTVLGPARDGGYYLIGLRTSRPDLFADMPWSTSAVFDITLRRIRKMKLSFYVLDELEDLDEAAVTAKTAWNEAGTLP